MQYVAKGWGALGWAIASGGDGRPEGLRSRWSGRIRGGGQSQGCAGRYCDLPSPPSPSLCPLQGETRRAAARAKQAAKESRLEELRGEEKAKQLKVRLPNQGAIPENGTGRVP